MATYFIHDDKNLQGPFSFEELKDKELKKDTPVWTEGLDNWVTAVEIPELRPLLAVAPPPFVQYPSRPKPPAFTQAAPVVEQVHVIDSAPTITDYDEYAYQSEMEAYFPTKTNWKTPLIAAGVLVVFSVITWMVMDKDADVPVKPPTEQGTQQGGVEGSSPTGQKSTGQQSAEQQSTEQQSSSHDQSSGQLNGNGEKRELANQKPELKSN